MTYTILQSPGTFGLVQIPQLGRIQRPTPSCCSTSPRSETLYETPTHAGTTGQLRNTNVVSAVMNSSCSTAKPTEKRITQTEQLWASANHHWHETCIFIRPNLIEARLQIRAQRCHRQIEKCWVRWYLPMSLSSLTSSSCWSCCLTRALSTQRSVQKHTVKYMTLYHCGYQSTYTLTRHHIPTVDWQTLSPN